MKFHPDGELHRQLIYIPLWIDLNIMFNSRQFNMSDIYIPLWIDLNHADLLHADLLHAFTFHYG